MNRFLPLLLALMPGFLLSTAHAMEATIKQAPFGKLASGAAVDLYTLTNASGMEARITNYGGIVVSLKTPDASGKLDDVVLIPSRNMKPGILISGLLSADMATGLPKGSLSWRETPFKSRLPMADTACMGGRMGSIRNCGK